jgi:hypothetical protein
MRIIRQRDKDDRLWRKFKSDGINDAVKRAEYEAKVLTDYFIINIFVLIIYLKF